MVIVEFMGGLGNQMFQYAFFKLLEKNGKEVYADLNWYRIDKECVNRKFELDRFGIELKEAGKKEITQLKGDYEHIIPKVKRKIWGPKKSFFIEKKEYEYDNNILELDNVYLSGYWQNYEYIKRIEHNLVNDFNFSNLELSDKERELLKKILKSESTSVHIRGEDYLTEVNKNIYGGICTRDYYEKAIKYLVKERNTKDFFVFTNDMEYAKTILAGIAIKEINIVFVDTSNNPLVDMYLMKECKNNIIANSSFSWWAALLNDNNDKLVVMPPKWTNKSDGKGLSFKNCVCI